MNEYKLERSLDLVNILGGPIDGNTQHNDAYYRAVARAEYLIDGIPTVDDLGYLEFMKRIKKLRDLRDIQGQDGNWNYDPYMFGLYNGLEMAVAILENRDPVYKNSPEEWLVDIDLGDVAPEKTADDGPSNPDDGSD